MSVGAFQSGRDLYRLLIAEGVPGFGIIGKRFPLHHEGLFGVHYFPGGVADNGHQVGEGAGIKILPFVVRFKGFDGKDIPDAGHGSGGGIVYRFQFHAECGRMDDHGDQHAVAAMVNTEQGVPGDDLPAVHIFPGCPDDPEVLNVLELYLLRHGKRGGCGSHFAVAGGFAAVFVVEGT